MNVATYLDRIKITHKYHDPFSFLAKLQKQHLLNIYFENIDIMTGKPLSLDAEEQYKKIIENHRGGVCFELNGLFHQLLKQLNYQVQMVAATVHTPNGWFPIENTHLTNLVYLGGRTYLVEVGFGGNSPRKPIPLDGEEIQDIDGIYQIHPDKEDPRFYVFAKKEIADWQPLYRFEMKAKRTDDFIEKCRIVETSPHSPFNKGYFLTKVTEEGRMTLTDHSLTVVEKGKKTKQKIAKEQIPALIKEYFKLSIK